jgi:hypothetical protein
MQTHASRDTGIFREDEGIVRKETIMEQVNNVAICQSCGMRMPTGDLYGTRADGTTTSEYCTYCYQDGAFLGPTDTVEAMIEVCVPFMIKEGMPEAQARKLLSDQLPNLKRWAVTEK